MDHIAINLGGFKSQVCVRNAGGDILEEKRIETAQLKQFLGGRAKARVVMETCAESWAIGDAALEADHELRIVPGSLVKALGVGARRVKTDQKDAEVLSEVSTRIDLPSVHLRSVEAREIQTMLHMRARVDRFQDAHRLESYLGLTPGEHSSSERQRRTSITKAGSSSLRYLLVEAAWTVYTHQPHSPLGRWTRTIEERRGRKVAIVALARKLAGICFAVWRDGTRYAPERAAQSPTA